MSDIPASLVQLYASSSKGGEHASEEHQDTSHTLYLTTRTQLTDHLTYLAHKKTTTDIMVLYILKPTPPDDGPPYPLSVRVALWIAGLGYLIFLCNLLPWVLNSLYRKITGGYLHPRKHRQGWLDLTVLILGLLAVQRGLAEPALTMVWVVIRFMFGHAVDQFAALIKYWNQETVPSVVILHY